MAGADGMSDGAKERAGGGQEAESERAWSEERLS